MQGKKAESLMEAMPRNKLHRDRGGDSLKNTWVDIIPRSLFTHNYHSYYVVSYLARGLDSLPETEVKQNNHHSQTGCQLPAWTTQVMYPSTLLDVEHPSSTATEHSKKESSPWWSISKFKYICLWYLAKILPTRSSHLNVKT